MKKKLVVITIIVLFSIIVVMGTVMLTSSRGMREKFAPFNGKNASGLVENGTISRAELIAQSEANADVPLYYFIPIIAFSGLGVGALVYYLVSGDKQTTDTKKFREALLSTLHGHEKEVVELLLDNNGAVAQYELARLSGMNKVQTHRLLLKMEQNGIITKRRLGKVNKIELNKGLVDALK